MKRPAARAGCAGVDRGFQEQHGRLVWRAAVEDRHRTVATCKLEGVTNFQIADKVGIVIHAVERKLELIGGEWSQELGE